MPLPLEPTVTRNVRLLPQQLVGLVGATVTEAGTLAAHAADVASNPVRVSNAASGSAREHRAKNFGSAVARGRANGEFARGVIRLSVWQMPI